MSRRRHLASLYASGELAALVKQHKTIRALAAHFGMERKGLSSLMDRMRAAGEMGSWEEMAGGDISKPDISDSGGKWPSVAAFDSLFANSEPLPALPDGHVVRGVSTLVGADGETKAQWIKTTNANEVDPAEVLRRAFGDEMPKAEPVTAPTHTADDLLATYLIGDGHLGLHAWRQDSGGDWDLGIAERTLFGAVDRLVALSPAASRGLIVNIGDFFHADSNAGTTTKGTRVDVDTRWSKVLAVGIRLMRRMIERALEKHAEVTVINEIGNHDTHTSLVLAMCLAQFYEREPRVIIDTSPQHFHYYRFGKVLIGTHHGHMVKVDKLPGVMATDRPVDWGETLYRHWDTGHVHHVTFHEFPGCTVRTLGVMVPGDAWHWSSGYRSGREMISTIYHREFGPLTTNRVGYHQLAAT